MGISAASQLWKNQTFGSICEEKDYTLLLDLLPAVLERKRDSAVSKW